MSKDAEFLQRFVEERSESPLAELVGEHVNLVCSAALRNTNGDRTLAEDLAQASQLENYRKQQAVQVKLAKAIVSKMQGEAGSR
jgi:hypothetical protein